MYGLDYCKVILDNAPYFKMEENELIKKIKKSKSFSIKSTNDNLTFDDCKIIDIYNCYDRSIDEHIRIQAEQDDEYTQNMTHYLWTDIIIDKSDDNRWYIYDGEDNWFGITNIIFEDYTIEDTNNAIQLLQ